MRRSGKNPAGKDMESLKEVYKIGRGPSSSHTMGPSAAAGDVKRKYPDATAYRAVLYGSLAHTGKGHLTDVAVREALSPLACEIVFDRDRRDLPHPNYLGTTGYCSVGGGNIREAGAPDTPPRNVYPFESFSELMRYAGERGITLDKIVYEFDEADIGAYLIRVWRTMQETIRRGLATGGVLPGPLKVERKARTLLGAAGEEEGADTLEHRLVCAYAYAASEENAAGGTVVTAPTCGSSGVLPATLYYLRAKWGYGEKEIADALAVAGLVGATVKQNASVSGAEAGCQAEIGTATAMAAAAVCRLWNAPANVIEYAAEIALEHQLGLTCDPVGGYVQIPCIERNAVAALRAISSAELARVLAGTRKISFDTVVATMYATGKDISERYRETSEGGLAALFKC